MYLPPISLHYGGGIIAPQRPLLDKEAKRIDEEYDKKHVATIVGSTLTAGAAFYPWLAPLLGSAALLVPVGKAAIDFYNKFQDRQTLARSLTGTLSHAQKRNKLERNRLSC